jgi:hypothetical protein
MPLRTFATYSQTITIDQEIVAFVARAGTCLLHRPFFLCYLAGSFCCDHTCRRQVPARATNATISWTSVLQYPAGPDLEDPICVVVVSVARLLRARWTVRRRVGHLLRDTDRVFQIWGSMQEASSSSSYKCNYFLDLRPPIPSRPRFGRPDPFCVT